MYNPIRLLLFVASSIAWAIPASAQLQSVLASSGGYFKKPSRSIAFTIGELVIATKSNGGVTITQGFHQPQDGFSSIALAPVAATAPDVASIAGPGIAAFPNPARDEVFVMLPGPDSGWSCMLYDHFGRIVLQQALPLDRNTLDLSVFANGPYALRLLDASGRPAHTFQLIIAK
jgi:hypothetical protein